MSTKRLNVTDVNEFVAAQEKHSACVAKLAAMRAELAMLQKATTSAAAMTEAIERLVDGGDDADLREKRRRMFDVQETIPLIERAEQVARDKLTEARRKALAQVRESWLATFKQNSARIAEALESLAKVIADDLADRLAFVDSNGTEWGNLPAFVIRGCDLAQTAQLLLMGAAEYRAFIDPPAPVTPAPPVADSDEIVQAARRQAKQAAIDRVPASFGKRR